jgi:hypothetical protein
MPAKLLANVEPADEPAPDPTPAPDSIPVAEDQHVVIIAPKPGDPLPPTDPNSEDYRFTIGAHPDTAAADLDRALTKGAGHPTPYPQAQAERLRAQDEKRLANLHPHTASDVADQLFPNRGNRHTLVAQNSPMDDPYFSGWIEHAQNTTIKYQVQKNHGDQPLEFAYPNGQTALCQPGDFFGQDAQGNRIVLTAQTVHGEYRLASYRPDATRILY